MSSGIEPYAQLAHEACLGGGPRAFVEEVFSSGYSSGIVDGIEVAVRELGPAYRKRYIAQGTAIGVGISLIVGAISFACYKICSRNRQSKGATSRMPRSLNRSEIEAVKVPTDRIEEKEGYREQEQA